MMISADLEIRLKAAVRSCYRETVERLRQNGAEFWTKVDRSTRIALIEQYGQFWWMNTEVVTLVMDEQTRLENEIMLAIGHCQIPSWHTTAD